MRFNLELNAEDAEKNVLAGKFDKSLHEIQVIFHALL